MPFLLFLQEATRPAIPILLAVGAVHQHLIQNGLRMSASIIVDTAQCFSTHQFACLIGYGARSFLLHENSFWKNYLVLLHLSFFLPFVNKNIYIIVILNIVIAVCTLVMSLIQIHLLHLWFTTLVVYHSNHLYNTYFLLREVWP